MWSCEKCKNFEKRTTPCKHLEALISESTSEPSFEGTHRRVDKRPENLYYESGAGFVIPPGIRSGRYEAQFRNKLTKFGLQPIEVDVLVLRFVYEESIRDISEELRIISKSEVLNILTNALKELKRRRFGKK